MKKYDAIVIGAGNGGLTCAAVLAQAKKRVLLVERHNLPGGFATSFKRGRFEFEASLHELCGYGDKPGEGAVRQIFESLGVADKIEMARVPAAFRVITRNDDDNIDAAMPFGVEEFIDKIEEYVPGSRPSVEKLFGLAEEIRNAIDFLGGIENYDLDAVKAILGEHMSFIHTAGYSVNEVMDVFEIPQKARGIITAYWSYLGQHCDELSFIHYIAMVMSYLKFGAVIPVQRSHGMSSILLERFEEFGGEVWLNSHVEKIIMYQGAAKGIILADGTRAYADNIVCNCSPHNVFSKMIDKKYIPVNEIKKANARVFGPRGFGVFLGLNKSPEELGIKNHSYFIYDTADTKKQFELMKNIETNNVQATVCLNHAIKDCSPEGTTIMYFTKIYSDDCWAKVTARNYFDTKQKIAESMINDFESATGIKIRDSIEEIEISTPMTYARYTNTPQGVIYGYLAADWDGIVARIMMDASDEKIPGLRFTGGYSTQNLGYSSTITDGRNTALKVLADIG